MNTYLKQLFSGKRFSNLHDAVSFVSRFDSLTIFLEFNHILQELSADDEFLMQNLLHIEDDFTHNIDMLISSLAMYSYKNEIADFQNTLNLLRTYITKIPKNKSDYENFMQKTEKVDFADEKSIEHFVRHEKKEVIEKKETKTTFLNKFPLANFFSKFRGKKHSTDESKETNTDDDAVTDSFVPIKTDKEDRDNTANENSSDDDYSPYKMMLKSIGYTDSIVSDTNAAPTDSLLQESAEDEEDTFVSLRSDDGIDEIHYSPISLREDTETEKENDTIVQNDITETAPSTESVETAAVEDIDSTVEPETTDEPTQSFNEAETPNIEETTPIEEVDNVVSEVKDEPTQPFNETDVTSIEDTTPVEEVDNVVSEVKDEPAQSFNETEVSSIEDTTPVEEVSDVVSEVKDEPEQSISEAETPNIEETTPVEEVSIVTENQIEESTESAETSDMIDENISTTDNDTSTEETEKGNDTIVKNEITETEPSSEPVETAAVEDIDSTIVSETADEHTQSFSETETPNIEETTPIEEVSIISESQIKKSAKSADTYAKIDERISNIDNSTSDIANPRAKDTKKSSDIFVSSAPMNLNITKQRIEYRNSILQALLDVYHDKKTGYKLMLGLFRGLDVYRRMCLTGEDFNKELFMRNFRKYLTHFPDANLIMLCQAKLPDISAEIIDKHIINCLKILNHHVDKTRFKLLFNDKLNLRSGFNWEYQQRILWLYFPDKRKPKRDIDEIYAVKSVTESTAAKTENSKVKKYQSYISMLSSRDITLANQILGVLHTIYYKRRDCKKFLFHIFKSLDEYDLSAFDLTPKQKAVFEANFNKTVLNTNKNPNYPNLFKMIVQNIPKIKPREIESLLPICIRIMKEKIDIGYERKKRKQPDLANSFNPLEKYSQIYEKKLFVIYKTV